VAREDGAGWLVSQVHGGQAQQQRHDHGGHDEGQAKAVVVVVHLGSGHSAGRAPAFGNRPSTLSADQMLAAHLASSGAVGYPVTSTMLDVPTQFPP
jgi:hypothetical protein